MSKPLEEFYVVSCPFCRYRRLFSSGVAMVVTYGIHLCDHEEVARKQAFGPGLASDISEARISEHAQRLRMARFN